MSSRTPCVPDLLKRFVPAPYKLDALICRVPVTLETNDPDIVDEIARASADLKKRGKPTLRLTVIRDNEAPDGDSETVVLSSGPVVSLLVGAGTILALDAEQREIVGFLAPQVSAKRFALELLPFLLHLYRTIIAANNLKPSDTVPIAG
jgi:hypothetical protein